MSCVYSVRRKENSDCVDADEVIQLYIFNKVCTHRAPYN